MADNVVLNTGVGGQTAATDDCAGVQYQRIKLTDGTADSTTVIASGNGTSTNALRVALASDSGGLGGVISTANSTTSNLSGAAVFTGTAEVVKDYAAIQVYVFSSHASATDGLSIQQSSDGTNWDVTDTYTIPATTGKTFSFQVAGSQYRLVYTNGATLTTSLRIQTVFHYATGKASSQRPADAVSNENDFEMQSAFVQLYNGTTWDRMRGDITNGLDVDVTRVPTDPFGANADAASATGSISAKLRFIAATGIPITGTVTVASHAVTNAGTFAVQVSAALPTGANTIGAVNIAAAQTLSTVTTVSTLTSVTGGGVAHDGADSGNPIKVGAKCSLTLSDDTIVANADRTDLTSDGDGTLLVRETFPLADLLTERVSDTTGTSTASTVFGATASTRNYITAYSFFRTDAGTTPIYVDIRDGTAGAILWSVVLPPNGGANLATSVPLFRSSVNTALAFDVSAAISTVYMSWSGFKSKV